MGTKVSCMSKNDTWWIIGWTERHGLSRREIPNCSTRSERRALRPVVRKKAETIKSHETGSKSKHKHSRGSHATYKLEDTPAHPDTRISLTFSSYFLCWAGWLNKGISSNPPFQRHSQLTLLISMLLFFFFYPASPSPFHSCLIFFRAWKRAPNNAAWMKWIVIPAKALGNLSWPSDFLSASLPVPIVLWHRVI